MASSVDRTEGTSSSSAQALGSRVSLTVDTARSRKRTAPAPGSAPYDFRPRNLGLTGERPQNLDVARGHYLDILV